MTAYKFDRFRILVVDDNKFTRDTLAKVLATFGVGEIIKAVDGLQALKVMKDGVHGFRIHFDIVISDVFMPSVDGFKLLQWVRESNESPNRFMPFIMMSGAAEDASVARARDRGANEFLAKPFSPQSVSERLLSVIDRPRQFIATQAYFGPDRKRRRDVPVIDDRRQTDESDINVIYSSEKIVRPRDPSDVYHFRLPNTLREKAGGGPNTVGEIPTAALEEADEVLGRSAEVYRDWIMEVLRDITISCRKAADLPPAKRASMFDRVNKAAHDLRGQGGIFGYPIVSTAGEMLYALTDPPRDMRDDAIGLVQAHLDLIHRVFLDRITGDGGVLGTVLINELRKKVEQALERKSDRAPEVS